MKRILAGVLGVCILLLCTACNRSNPTNATEAVTTANTETTETLTDLTATEPTETSTEDDLSTTEPETADATATTDTSATTDVTATTDAAATTTIAAAAAKAPSTKAEIVDYFNAAYKKVKTEKPGYTTHERTFIDENIYSSKNWLKNVASLVLPMAKGLFTKWTDPEVVAKGANHSKLPPYVDVKPEWIKSATCKESGGNYVIRLNLVNESVPVLPKDNQSTIHGKMLDRGVFNWEAVMDGVEQISVINIEINTFACDYSGSYLEATINKTTGAVVKVTTWTACQANVEAKVPVFGVLDASVPMSNETEYYDFGK